MTQDKQERIENELNKIALFLKNSPQYKSQLNIIHELEKIAQNNNRDSSLETLDILENVAGEYFVPDSSQATSSAASTLSAKDKKDIKRLIKNCERHLSWAAEQELHPTDMMRSSAAPEKKNKAWFDVLPEEIIRNGIARYLTPVETVKLTLAYKDNLQTRRMLQPEYRASLIREHVAKGQQNEAKLLLDKYKSEETKAPSDEKTKFTDNPLLLEGTFTDYSGRTFTCTAYEYAYWAKDRHMLRMLEAQMDESTKAAMLLRINALDEKGLTYTQHGETITGSRHFDITPLKTAYEDHIRLYTAWEQAGYPNEDKAAVREAWMNVGKAQRDLPVHYVNEYFRKDRSFHPTPGFNETDLPRELTFKNWVTDKVERLFPLVLTASSGLGVDFAFIRGDVPRSAARATGLVGGVWYASIDMPAITRLDEVRTNDLIQSRKNLEPSAPTLEPSAPTLGMSR